MLKVLSETRVHRGSVGEAGSMYTRLLATDPDGPNGGAMLLTWELRLGVADPEGPSFPIMRSLDGGYTWERIADVDDTAYGFGNRYQPTLYELPEDFAGLERGTILLAGNAIPWDGASTNLVLYCSEDGGRCWRYLSTIDSGGPAVYDSRTTATTTSVWEPELALEGGILYCYYADERLKAEGMLQIIARRDTIDLVNWGDREVIKGVPNRFERPGMWVCSGRMPDGKYRAVMEVVGPRDVPIYFLESGDGVNWGDRSDIGTLMVAEDGVALSGTPNVSWRTNEDGTTLLIATARHTLENEVETNRALISFDMGKSWKSFELPTSARRFLKCDSSGYSQSVRWNPAGELVQATTIRNEWGSHDVVITVSESPAEEEV